MNTENQMILLKLFSLFFKHILVYDNSKTIQYLVTTFMIFEYYSEITNGPNTTTNNNIWSQLFEYQIIQIIRCNSGYQHHTLNNSYCTVKIKILNCFIEQIVPIIFQNFHKKCL